MKDEAEQKSYQLGNRTCSDHNGDERLAWVCLECVAAALREAQQDGYIKGWTAGNEHEDALDAEIAKLRARISEQEGQIDRADEHTAKIMKALEVAERERDAAIQIEIDNKAKAGKT